MTRPHHRRPPFQRRDQIGFVWTAWLVILGGLVAAIILHTPPAHGTPLNTDQQAFDYWSHHGSSVCAALDRDPSIDGLATTGLDIIAHTSLTVKQAGQVVGLAIHFTCPRHQHLIDEYAASQRGSRSA